MNNVNLSGWWFNFRTFRWELCDLNGKVIGWIAAEAWDEARRNSVARRFVRERFGSCPNGE